MNDASRFVTALRIIGQRRRAAIAQRNMRFAPMRRALARLRRNPEFRLNRFRANVNRGLRLNRNYRTRMRFVRSPASVRASTRLLNLRMMGVRARKPYVPNPRGLNEPHKYYR